MPETPDLTAWSAALTGLYARVAGIGALRNAQAWRRMIEEVAASPALQLLCGLLELVVGALVYLANPWTPSDLLACAMKAMGGVLMVEALAIAGFCDLYTQFWLRSLNLMHRGWPLFTMALGLALTLAGMLRFV